MAEPDAGARAAARGLAVIDSTTYKVKFGGDEINETRDMIADISGFGPVVPANEDGRLGMIFFKTPS